MPVSAWNVSTHMISGAIAYRILQAERPGSVSAVQAMLEKHPGYADRWQADLETLLESQRGEMLFMLAARWADDIRTKDRLQHRGPWHYINWPFKPDGVYQAKCSIARPDTNCLASYEFNRINNFDFKVRITAALIQTTLPRPKHKSLQ